MNIAKQISKIDKLLSMIKREVDEYNILAIEYERKKKHANKIWKKLHMWEDWC